VHVAAVGGPRRHVRLGGVRDFIAVVINVTHLAPSGFVRPEQVGIHPEPMKVRMRPDVERDVVAGLW